MRLAPAFQFDEPITVPATEINSTPRGGQQVLNSSGRKSLSLFFAPTFKDSHNHGEIVVCDGLQKVTMEDPCLANFLKCFWRRGRSNRFRNRHDEQRSRHFIFLEPGPLRFGSNTEFIYLMISSFKEGWLNLWMGKILLVDDNDTLAVMIKKMLEIGDYEVIRAKNGNDALRLYDSKTIDLVLTDLIMPEKEGIQLISELRHINPAIKIVAMSGGGIVGPQVTLPIAKHLGAIRTLTKPFTADELLTTIEYALHGTT